METMQGNDVVKQGVKTGGDATKLSTKDYVTAGIFAVLHAVVLFVVAAVMGISAIGFPLYGLVGYIPCGIIFVYIVTRVPKRGVVLALGAISALLYFIIGAYGFIPLFVLAGGVVGELIVSAGKYKNFPLILVGYVAFALLVWFGFMSPIAFTMEGYMAGAVESYGADYMTTMIGYLQSPLIVVLGLLNALGAVVGVLFGRKLFAKHFSRIGA